MASLSPVQESLQKVDADDTLMGLSKHARPTSDLTTKPTMPETQSMPNVKAPAASECDLVCVSENAGVQLIDMATGLEA